MLRLPSPHLTILRVCREHAIVHIHDRYPIFIEDRCNGCGTCILACPNRSIKADKKVIGSLYK
ncbi:MAG: ATP-binding protein, partial [Bacteroidales bacterium]